VNPFNITLSHYEDGADRTRNYAHRFNPPPKGLAKHVSSLGLAILILQHVGVVKLLKHISEPGIKQQHKESFRPPRTSKVDRKSPRQWLTMSLPAHSPIFHLSYSNMLAVPPRRLRIQHPAAGQ